MDHRRLILNEKFELKIDAKPDEEIKVETKGDDADELIDFVHSILGDNIDFFDSDFPGEDDEEADNNEIEEDFGDNAVKDCKVNKVIAHCEEEKPVCKVEKPVLPDELTDPDKDMTDDEFYLAFGKALKEKREADALNEDSLGHKLNNLKNNIAFKQNLNKATKDALKNGIDSIIMEYAVVSADRKEEFKTFNTIEEAKRYAMPLSKQKGETKIIIKQFQPDFKDLKVSYSGKEVSPADVKMTLLLFKNGAAVNLAGTTSADYLVKDMLKRAKDFIAVNKAANGGEPTADVTNDEVVDTAKVEDPNKTVTLSAVKQAADSVEIHDDQKEALIDILSESYSLNEEAEPEVESDVQPEKSTEEKKAEVRAKISKIIKAGKFTPDEADDILKATNLSPLKKAKVKNALVATNTAADKLAAVLDALNESYDYEVQGDLDAFDPTLAGMDEFDAWADEQAEIEDAKNNEIFFEAVEGDSDNFWTDLNTDLYTDDKASKANKLTTKETWRDNLSVPYNYDIEPFYFDHADIINEEGETYVNKEQQAKDVVAYIPRYIRLDDKGIVLANKGSSKNNFRTRGKLFNKGQLKEVAYEKIDSGDWRGWYRVFVK